MPWCCQGTRTQKIENESFIQRLVPIINQMFQIVPCAIGIVSCKCHENPLIGFTVMLLTGTPRHLYVRLWNSLGRCEIVYLIISCVVPGISWKFMKIRYLFFRNITNKHGFREKGELNKAKTKSDIMEIFERQMQPRSIPLCGNHCFCWWPYHHTALSTGGEQMGNFMSITQVIKFGDKQIWTRILFH